MRPVLAAALLAAGVAHAQAAGDDGAADWTALVLEMIGGIAPLFLHGVDLLAGALREGADGRMQRLLQRGSAYRLGGLAGGTVATVVLDSSSVVIILLIPFAAALPVILGANIGTTFSSQLFAWNVDAYSPVLIVAGLVLQALGRGDRAKRTARGLLGLGLVLFGLHIIGVATEPLQGRPEVLRWLARFDDPWMGVAAGAVATVAIQSSSAMIGIVITLAGGGLIALPAGVAIMLGAEIGTCADTLVATLGRSRAAVKAGVFHLLFNIACVVVGVLLIDRLAGFGSATASDTGQRIANAHVLFNVAGALLALPFVCAVAGLLDRMVPDRGGTRDPQSALGIAGGRV